MKLNKSTLLIMTGLLLATDISIAASAEPGARPRTRSEEELAAVLAESERTAEEENTSRSRAPDPELKAALEASKGTAAEEARKIALGTGTNARREATIAIRAEQGHSSENWHDPVYIRGHLEELIPNNAAYRVIVSTNGLSMEERTMKEGEFNKGGGKFEEGYRRAKLLRVIAKLEASSGGAAGGAGGAAS